MISRKMSGANEILKQTPKISCSSGQTRRRPDQYNCPLDKSTPWPACVYLCCFAGRTNSCTRRCFGVCSMKCSLQFFDSSSTASYDPSDAYRSSFYALNELRPPATNSNSCEVSFTEKLFVFPRLSEELSVCMFFAPSGVCLVYDYFGHWTPSIFPWFIKLLKPIAGRVANQQQPVDACDVRTRDTPPLSTALATRRTAHEARPADDVRLPWWTVKVASTGRNKSNRRGERKGLPSYH